MSLADQHWRADDLRASAMRGGYSGSAYGLRSTGLSRRRAPAERSSWWLVAIAVAVTVVGHLAGWW